MKERRLISLQTIEESVSHAIVKARADVNVVLQSAGYKPLTFGSTSPIGLWRVLIRHWNILSLRWKIKKTDVVFIQFPWIHNNKTEFYHNLFNSGAQVDCVIHDLDSFRCPEDKQHNDELVQLNRCHSIIAHTPAMKEFLLKNGVDGDKIKILNFFPYLTSDPLRSLSPDSKPVVVFAGNLEKSPFVNHLGEIASDNLRFNLYGKGAGKFVDSEYVKYKGVFEPNHPAAVEGNWGLVWDGAELETCSGLYGNYLRYNSSHKISLYLAMGIPVILWEESSLRDVIEKHNLGITISSLTELESKISKMPASTIAKIQQSVREFAPQIRSGEIFRKHL